jgi:hypothetical protein
MQIKKHVLRPERLRRIPGQFSWIDQRLVRDRHLRDCDHAALALYLVLRITLVGEIWGGFFHAGQGGVP